MTERDSDGYAVTYDLLRAVFENTDDNILLSDADAKPILFNTTYAASMKQLLGVEMAPGFQPHTVLPPEQREVWEAFHRRVLAGESFVAEFDHEAAPGDLLTFEIAYKPIFKNGAVTGFSETTRDITARKRAERERRQLQEQLLRAQKLDSLGVLASGVAHDFNNILVGILGNISLVLEDLSEESPVRGQLEDVEAAARRAAELTHQMLAYAGKSSSNATSFDVAEVIDELTTFVAPAISSRVELDYRPEPSLPPINGDAGQIRQAVLNVITNGAEAIGGKAGKIVIATGTRDCDRACLDQARPDEELPTGRYLTIGVSDDGCGMDADTRARVFDPFFSTKFAGRGFGLAAVHGIVRAHRGAITVESEPGHGARFTLLLPASAATG